MYFLLSSFLWLSKWWCFYWCISRTWVYGLHIDIDMDGSFSFDSCPWTTYLPSICCMHDFLNLLHNTKILYLFFITFQSLSLNYGSLFIIRIILVGFSTTCLSRYFHYLLNLIFLHYDRVHGLLLSLLHFSLHPSSSSQCFSPSPVHVGRFSCLMPLSLHLFYIVKY
jgi:hypothetical protein